MTSLVVLMCSVAQPKVVIFKLQFVTFTKQLIVPLFSASSSKCDVKYKELIPFLRANKGLGVFVIYYI